MARTATRCNQRVCSRATKHPGARIWRFVCGRPPALSELRREQVDKSGPKLFALLERAILYGDRDKQAETAAFLDQAIDAFNATYAFARLVRGPTNAERVKAFLDKIAVFRGKVISELRIEMGLTRSDSSVWATSTAGRQVRLDACGRRVSACTRLRTPQCEARRDDPSAGPRSAA